MIESQTAQFLTGSFLAMLVVDELTLPVFLIWLIPIFFFSTDFTVLPKVFSLLGNELTLIDDSFSLFEFYLILAKFSCWVL